MYKKLIFIFIIFSLLLVACDDPGPANTAQSQAQEEAISQAANASYYIPKNNVELRNYNWRMEVGDDPTTILWCTFVFPMTDYDLITVPIIGKLTSGSKRPFPAEQILIDTNTDSRRYNPELPGADGMFGSSGEYRYGFGPGGMNEYYDFYNLPSFCTTFPTVFQTHSTIMMFEGDTRFMEASRLAQAAMQAGNTEEARRILETVISSEVN